jgi:hypothetical protein
MYIQDRTKIKLISWNQDTLRTTYPLDQCFFVHLLLFLVLPAVGSVDKAISKAIQCSYNPINLQKMHSIHIIAFLHLN